MTRFGSGQQVLRREDASLLQGKGQYTDDFSPAGVAHLVFLRSPHAHAHIVSMDTSEAAKMPGVIGILTGEQLVQMGVKPIPLGPMLMRPDGTPGAAADRRALAYKTVRYVGEPMVAVIAESVLQGKDALDAIMVEFEDLPSVTEPQKAMQAGAPVIAPGAPDNVGAQMKHGDAKAAAAAFEKAAHVVKLNLVNQRLAPASIEPRTALCSFDDGRYQFRMSTQMPTGVRDTFSQVMMGIPNTDVRVVVGDVGGGFGMKTGMYPEDAVVGIAAKQFGRPVKWVSERSEEFLSAVHGRDIVSDAELALDAQGKILALRIDTLANVGAYGTTTGMLIQLMIGPWVSTSVYDVPVIDFRMRAVLTNTGTTGAYRGAGRPEAIYIMERLMDAAARKLSLDPSEIRRRNFVSPAQMPYKNGMQQVYDSGQFEKVMDQALALGDWNGGGYAARHAASAAKGKLRGRSLTTFLEWTSGNAFEEKVTVTVAADGFIEIVSATMAMGQGIVTSYAQLAVDIFDVPIEKIRIVQGDTDRANGFGSAGSRSLFTGGSAVQEGSKLTIKKATSLAADELEVAEGDVEYTGGEFKIVGTDRKISLFDLAAKQNGRQIQMDATTTAGGPSWPNGAHICEVEIDAATGEVTLDTYAQVNDVGRVVSPQIVVGQLEGGVMQGVGQALCEQIQYDAESGQLLTGSLMDYTLPRADMIPSFQTRMDESTPCKTNQLGVKGVGELGTIGATPATINAVNDALVRAGVPLETVYTLQMPYTSQKIWQALQKRKA